MTAVHDEALRIRDGIASRQLLAPNGPVDGTPDCSASLCLARIQRCSGSALRYCVLGKRWRDQSLSPAGEAGPTQVLGPSAKRCVVGVRPIPEADLRIAALGWLAHKRINSRKLIVRWCVTWSGHSSMPARSKPCLLFLRMALFDSVDGPFKAGTQRGHDLRDQPGLVTFRTPLYPREPMSLLLKTILVALAMSGVATTGYVFYQANISSDNWIYEGGKPTNWKDGGVHGAPGPIAGAGLPVLVVGYGVYWVVRRQRRKKAN